MIKTLTYNLERSSVQDVAVYSVIEAFQAQEWHAQN
jgi:hypothetical protein